MLWLLPIALASPDDLAIAEADRGLVIGRGNLAAGADAGVFLAGDALVPQLAVPVRYGVTDGLEVFAGPQLQTEEPRLRDPALGAALRFTDGTVEAGLRLSSDLAVFGADKVASVEVGLPARVHVGRVAVDTGFFARFGVVGDEVATYRAPVDLRVSAADRMAVTVGSGIVVAGTPEAGASAPLRAGGSLTLARHDEPWLELGAAAAWSDVQALDALGVAATARWYLARS